jgi:hypothetical protein
MQWRKGTFTQVSAFAEQEVHHPAAAHMLPRLTAVVQDVGVVAASVFQCVGQDGKLAEGMNVPVDQEKWAAFWS